MRFPVVVYKDKRSDYGVTVPDLPGCVSAGASMEEALEAVKEAIICHLEGMLLDHEPLPRPKPIEAHRGNPDYADGVWAVVEIDPAKISGKVKRVNVSLPESLLEEVDDLARKTGETRSGLLAHAVMEYLSEGSGH